MVVDVKRICVANYSCDANEGEFGNGWARQLEKIERSGTPNAGICTSIRRHLNFKRPDVRSGGATRIVKAQAMPATEATLTIVPCRRLAMRSPTLRATRYLAGR